jgi:hypothetical protein
MEATRVVHHADAIAWLRQQGRLQGASVITSLPDVSEVCMKLDDWRPWFEDTAALVMQSIDPQGVAIFFQSDIKHAGRWIDKGAFVTRAAERVGLGMLFHKIVCRRPPGSSGFGRASYAHMLGFASWPLREKYARVDVFPDGGGKPGVKSMGVRACLDACQFVKNETPTRVVVDPFCGFGTVLAVANALGLDAVGVDLAPRMCRHARDLQIDPRDGLVTGGDIAHGISSPGHGSFRL